MVTAAKEKTSDIRGNDWGRWGSDLGRVMGGILWGGDPKPGGEVTALGSGQHDRGTGKALQMLVFVHVFPAGQSEGCPLVSNESHLEMEQRLIDLLTLGKYGYQDNWMAPERLVNVLLTNRRVLGLNCWLCTLVLLEQQLWHHLSMQDSQASSPGLFSMCSAHLLNAPPHGMTLEA